ncbi:hypothetical protein F3157_13735 [Virgibacillus dakarensis]|uniref:Uncharacterized protein n=1 Tax=Lentibacillus populi TaxID=1827502 RepID=A0A9W5U1G0_9BACI|nr:MULTISPECIES: hypothetical protein [Bacillaceae]MBT2217670.1 hypothetical protein [Virgibacillus dakarensis]MTW86714.1 hypothetical protein [Virgibacillus dakarensis]GGB57113.1 hypothetical protein GCM10011409_38300 [Lentibacillus populi]
MGIIVMFMLLATLTPFLFIHLHRKILAVVQTVMLVGMWLYYIEAQFHTAPIAFSIMWIMFYVSMILAEVAWVMFIIRIVKTSYTNTRTTKTFNH